MVQRGDPAAAGGPRAVERRLGADRQVLLPRQEPEPAQVQVRVREEQGAGEKGTARTGEAGLDRLRLDLSERVLMSILCSLELLKYI